ncbi:MAG: hypothetical protein K1X67_26700 [Fimbriimonadaceae bacterium]|nr:hypothetical protein [Fimbriimonadaceae bacterium]
MDISDYHFDAPLLVEPDSLAVLSSDDWETGEAWLEALSRYPNLCGIVLPLELESRSHFLQEAAGVSLLNWLRWSADEPVCRVPVLAVAFQPLEVLLRRTLNLLLVTRGTEFGRLPESKARLDSFVEAVRGPDAPTLWGDRSDLERLVATSGDAAAQISYHDLANDYYSASRLWAGYKAALDAAKQEFNGRAAADIGSERTRTEQIRFAWEDEKVKPLLKQPHVRHYLEAARKRLGSPLYPVVPKAEQVIRRHVENGLPSTTRILLVDDEFDKGLGDVLLQILFRQSEFSAQNGDGEQVYSEESGSGERWARFVCVKTADAAIHWLAYWGDVDYAECSEWSFKTERQHWLRTWASALNVPVQGEAEATDILGENRTCRIDSARARPKGVNTVVLLDLRLEPTEQRETYNPLGLRSVQLRKLIKRQEKFPPVIMLTASRQAMTYAVVMDDAERADGWLTKEGPDTPPDDENSARATHYLLERLHLFACVQDWYRDELRWDPGWKLEYAKWRGSPLWNESQSRIETTSTQLFRSIQQPEFRERHKYVAAGLGWADEHTTGCSSIERLLVVRRVVVAALLLTADWLSDQPRWNPDAFDALIPGKEGRLDVKAVYDVVKNFKVKLWLTSSKPELLGMLLPEEYQWLITQFPRGTYPNTYVHLEDKVSSL